MKIIENKLDLFKLPLDYTLVHCISEDCAMGAGIAKTFNKKYPNMKNELLNKLKENDLKYPTAILYRESADKHNVINMITKERYFYKPTYKNFEKALSGVITLCLSQDIKKIGMPQIGCGLDRLKWDKVKVIIEEKFENLDIEIEVCYL